LIWRHLAPNQKNTPLCVLRASSECSERVVSRKKKGPQPFSGHGPLWEVKRESVYFIV
jgi:hypothetical protein